MRLTAYMRAMRLERWPRSLAIFLGSAAFFYLNREALLETDIPDLIGRLILSFFLTWAISTANYIINEIVDIPYDIHHPIKRSRPLIKGEIRIIPFALLGIILTAASLFCAALMFSFPFFLSLLSLLMAGFIYNIRPIRTKDIPFLDSVSESVNNPIRFLIGWYACTSSFQLPPLSLLVSWWSFGNFLMVAKRLSEFRFLKDKAGDYRSSHKKYTKRSLLFGMIVSTLIFLTTYATFALSYKLQSFLYIIPLLLIFVLLIFNKTLKEVDVMEEPEKLLASPKFALYTILLLLFFSLSFFWDKIGQ